MTENYFFRNEHPVLGKIKKNKIQGDNRARAQSENFCLPDSDDDNSIDSAMMPPRGRARAHTEPIVDTDVEPIVDTDVQGSQRSGEKPILQKKVQSVLDQILREADYEGRGITTVASTEMILLLWMMLDAGQGWTAMALNLLSKHEDACQTVQSEVDRLEQTYGKERLFTSFVLGKMEKLDNLIYEAIRLCPEFMGGLKILKQTVELDGVQIPKNTNVILCNHQDEDTFTLDYPTPKRPEEMGMLYPSVEL
jgi:cytochrome P450